MKTVAQIYEHYNLMPNLREHMLGVAAVGALICDNFNGELSKDHIISACLLHDIGNILKFDLGRFPEFLQPQGLEYWQKAQKDFAQKYGNDEHRATYQICEELGVSQGTVELIKAVGFLPAADNERSDDFAKKICEYSDGRVKPRGVCSLEERFLDSRVRYQKKRALGAAGLTEVFESSLRKIEEQIFSRCFIRPEDITEASARKYFEALRNFIVV